MAIAAMAGEDRHVGPQAVRALRQDRRHLGQGGIREQLAPVERIGPDGQVAGGGGDGARGVGHAHGGHEGYDPGVASVVGIAGAIVPMSVRGVRRGLLGGLVDRVLQAQGLEEAVPKLLVKRGSANRLGHAPEDDVVGVGVAVALAGLAVTGLDEVHDLLVGPAVLAGQQARS